jgi:thymidylate synthase
MDEYFELAYARIIQGVLDHGEERKTRNETTVQHFGGTMAFDSRHIPLLLGRRIFWKGVAGELAAMLKGPKTVEDFRREGCNYWDKWADAEGNIEVDYGNRWLDFNGVDQLAALVYDLRTNPTSRRHIITGWDPSRLDKLSLPCCHLLYQWNVRDGKHLDLMWYQRSVDLMVGLPSDILFAWFWNELVAREVGLEAGRVIMFLGDCHVYKPHWDNARRYLDNVARLVAMAETGKGPEVPQLHGLDGQRLYDFRPKDLAVDHYEPLEKIDFELIT